jgi:hypothetical protein
LGWRRQLEKPSSWRSPARRRRRCRRRRSRRLVNLAVVR